MNEVESTIRSNRSKGRTVSTKTNRSIRPSRSNSMWLFYQNKFKSSFEMGLTRRQITILILIKRRERRQKVEAMKTKRVWVRQLYTERKGNGEYRSLIKEVQIFDEMLFSKQLRMMRQNYENLLTLVTPRITKSSVKREAISPGERLSVTW